MPIYHDGKKMKPYRGYRKPVNVYYGDKKVAGWKNSTQTGNNLTFQTTYNDTASVIAKGKTLQQSSYYNKTGLLTQQTWTGKNQFDMDAWYNLLRTNGTETTYPTSQGNDGTYDYIKANPSGHYDGVKFMQGKFETNTRYTLSFMGKADTINYTGLQFVYTDGTNSSVPISTTTWSAFSVTSTAGKTIDFIQLSYVNIAYGYFANIQLELGSIATSYEPYTGGIPAPNPSHPQPLISNLPAGTYYTTDYKGDKYDFTLAEDLCGIGDVKDSIEFDKYSHGGFERRKIISISFNGTENWVKYSDTDNLYYLDSAFGAKDGTLYKAFCTHFLWISDSVITGDNKFRFKAETPSTRLYIKCESTTSLAAFKSMLAAQYAAETPVTVKYQLATPTRTALTFTLNDASTAPECPMTFLTSTPSLEYPATVWDASGEVTSKTPNLTDIADHKNSFIDKYFLDTFPQSPSIVLLPNTQYTLSFDYKINSSTSTVVCGIGCGQLGYSMDIIGNAQYPNQSQGRLICTFMTPSSLAGALGTPYLRIRFVRMAFRGNADADISNITFALGTYSGKAKYKTPATATTEILRSNADGTVCDEFEVKTGKLTRKIGRIESYNGEDVGGDWISSTGALDTGATVEYVLAEPIEEQYTPVTLPTYHPTTVITTTNNTPAELTTTAIVKVEEV